MIRTSLTDVFFTKEDVEKLHESVLHILSTVGVKIENEEARGIYSQHGARVDGDIV